ncbi:TlpA family protein disulfide reductase [Halovivax gelatinilyticus]|uniref:TlpA family protein disulfide reductase n=1 Tax=Halovivax gelatinilyticus TaxID=2961597 RepID=UPI0020CA2A40|nr:TlpA disulfide reductase family protein [Halovivax gelatinilyticus]
MRRREALAGTASLGLLAAGGVVAIRGPPSFGSRDGNGVSADGEQSGYEPISVDTLDLPWGRDESVDVPFEGHITVVTFFATWCRTCSEMLADVTEARERVRDDAQFLSVTIERVGEGGQVTTADVEAWWRTHGGGEWTVGSDETAELQVRHDVPGVPATVVFDADGIERWSHVGVSTTDDLVDAVENARDAQR